MRTTLKHPMTYCEGCPLGRTKNKFTHYVPTDVYYDRVDEEGKPVVDILIVGDAPGKSEDECGMPFTGASGAELKNALKLAGVESSYAMANSVRCRPLDDTGKNRAPTTEEVASCANYLKQDLLQLKPKVVVIMGNNAKEAIAPNEWKSKGINQLKGEILVKDGVSFTATVHPSSYLRKDNYLEKQRFYKQIGNITRIVSGEQTAYSRKGVTTLLSTEAEVFEFFDLLETVETEFVCFDTETENLNRVAPNKVATIQFAMDNDMGFVIPIDHWQSPFSEEAKARIIARMGQIFSNPDLPFECWIAHGSKFDYNKVCRLFGIVRIAKPVVDTIMLEYLRDENQRRGADEEDGGQEGAGVAFDLKSRAKEDLGFHHYNSAILEVRESGSLIDEPLWKEDGKISDFTDYGGMDAYVGRRFACHILSMLEKTTSHKDKSWNFAKKWGGRVTHLLSKIEVNGAFADKDQLAYLQSDDSPILKRMAEIPKDIMETPEGKKANSLILQQDNKTKGMKPLFGKQPEVFSVDKKEHRISLLVDVCGLQPLAYGKLKDENGKEIRERVKKGEIAKGNGVASINKAFYKEHEGNYFSDIIQEYEGLKKLKSSYLNSVQSFLQDEIIYTKRGPKSNADNLFDGRIHATFWDSKTVTGRFASSNPNLQQLPSATSFSKSMIKSMYGAAPGHCIIEADYGQAEVRWWAQIAKDQEYAALFHSMLDIIKEYERNPTPELKKRVENECDIHKQVSSAMNRIPIEQVTKEMRQAAKGLAFGTIFGMSAKSLAILLKCSEAEAQELMATFINRFERAGGWLTYIEQFAIENGFVASPYGRVRHLAHLIESNESAMRRLARNSPIQGAASDTTALAGWRLQDWIERNNKPYKLWNIVHDAIYNEAPITVDHLREVMTETKRCMTDISGFLKDEFNIDLIVPLVIEFKVGLRGGHCKTVDSTTNLEEFVAVLQEHDRRLHNGDKWWQIQTELEIKSLEKEMLKLEADKKEGYEKKVQKKLLQIEEHKKSLARAM